MLRNAMIDDQFNPTGLGMVTDFGGETGLGLAAGKVLGKASTLTPRLVKNSDDVDINFGFYNLDKNPNVTWTKLTKEEAAALEKNNPNLFKVEQVNEYSPEKIKQIKDAQQKQANLALDFTEKWGYQNADELNRLEAHATSLDKQLQNATDANSRSKILKELLDTRQQIKEGKFIDPTFKEKVTKLFEEGNIANANSYMLDDPMYGPSLRDRSKLVYVNPNDPSINNLSVLDQDYVMNNFNNIGGVRTNDATITLGSKPTSAHYRKDTLTPNNQIKSEYILKQKTNYTPINDTGFISAHEGGHDLQNPFNWVEFFQEHDPKYNYYVGHNRNPIASRFKNAMIEPTLPGPDGRHTNESWLSGIGELHSNLMGERFKEVKDLMDYEGMSMDDAIKLLKKDPDPFLTRLINSDNSVSRHFKPGISNEEKLDLLRMLPALGVGALGIGAAAKSVGAKEPVQQLGGRNSFNFPISKERQLAEQARMQGDIAVQNKVLPKEAVKTNAIAKEKIKQQQERKAQEDFYNKGRTELNEGKANVRTALERKFDNLNLGFDQLEQQGNLAPGFRDFQNMGALDKGLFLMGSAFEPMGGGKPKIIMDHLNTISSNTNRNLTDLQVAQKFAKQYGYQLPANLERISQSDILTDRVIKGMMDRHNTFVRGVSTNWDELQKSLVKEHGPEKGKELWKYITNNFEKNGIDYINNPQGAAEYMATHIPISTGYGRVSLNKEVFNQGLEGLYTSNSIPTAEGYTYGQGFITKVKRPTKFSSTNRQDWITQNNPSYRDEDIFRELQLPLSDEAHYAIYSSKSKLWRPKSKDEKLLKNATSKQKAIKEVEYRIEELEKDISEIESNKDKWVDAKDVLSSKKESVKQLKDDIKYLEKHGDEILQSPGEFNILRTERANPNSTTDAHSFLINKMGGSKDFWEYLYKQQPYYEKDKELYNLNQSLTKHSSDEQQIIKEKIKKLEDETLSMYRQHLQDYMKIYHPDYDPVNRYAHYIFLGTPGKKVLEPIKSWEITPDIWKNKSRGHFNEHSKKLSTLEVGGKNINTTGYLDDSDTKHNPYNIIPSNNITMDGVSIPLMLMPDGDKARVVMPNSGEYNFPNSQYVTEIPLAQKGRVNYPQPTMQDSLNLYNNAIELQKFYDSKKQFYEKPSVTKFNNFDKKAIVSGQIKKDTLKNKKLSDSNKQIILNNTDPNIEYFSDLVPGAIDPDAPLMRYDKRIDPQKIVSYSPLVNPTVDIPERNLGNEFAEFFKDYNISKEDILNLNLDLDDDKFFIKHKDELPPDMLNEWNKDKNEQAAKLSKKYGIDKNKILDFYKSSNAEYYNRIKQIDDENLERWANSNTPGAYTRIPMYDPIAVKPFDMRTPEEIIEWEQKYGTSQPQPKLQPKSKLQEKPIERTTLEPVESRTVPMLESNFEYTPITPMSVDRPMMQPSNEEYNRQYSITIPTIEINKRQVAPRMNRVLGQNRVNPKNQYQRSIDVDTRQLPIMDEYTLNKLRMKLGMNPKGFQTGGQAVKKGPGPFLIPESRPQFKSMPVPNRQDPRFMAYQDSVIQNNKSIQALQDFNKAYNAKQPYVATPENLTDDYKNSGVKQQAKYTNPKNTKNYLQPSKKIDDLNEEQRANLIEAFDTQQEGTPINLPTALYYGDMFNNSTYRNEDIWFDYHTNPVQPYHVEPMELIQSKTPGPLSTSFERPAPSVPQITPYTPTSKGFSPKTEGLTVPVPTVEVSREVAPPRSNQLFRKNVVNPKQRVKTNVKVDIDQREIMDRAKLDSLRESMGLEPKGYQRGGEVDDNAFKKFVVTLPPNLRNTGSDYNLRGYWESLGKPSAFDYSQPKELDGRYHGYSRNSKTGEILKRPNHPTFGQALEDDIKLGYYPYESPNGVIHTFKQNEVPQGFKPNYNFPVFESNEARLARDAKMRGDISTQNNIKQTGGKNTKTIKLSSGKIITFK